MQFNKIPTTRYAMQWDMGAWFSQGIGGRGIIQTLELIVLSQRPISYPWTLNCPFFLMHPVILFFQELVEVVNALGMKRYRSEFHIGESHQFLKIVFFPVVQENTQKCVPKPFLTHVFLFLVQLELVGCFPLTFFYNSFISPWWGTHFCIAQWLGREIHDLGVCRGRFCP